MKISARNQLKGTVSAIAEGAVNGVVSIDLGSTVVKADITMEAINDLGLRATCGFFSSHFVPTLYQILKPIPTFALLEA